MYKILREAEAMYWDYQLKLLDNVGLDLNLEGWIVRCKDQQRLEGQRWAIFPGTDKNKLTVMEVL